MGAYLNELITAFSLTGQLMIYTKLILAAVLGYVIGWNRRSKSAGLRTFILITLGATIFTIVSMIGFPNNSEVSDQARLVAQVVTGVGFIGAGVIWKNKGNLTGLTTAAAIWIAAAIGIAVGVGMFALAVFGTLLTLIILNLKRILPNYEDEDDDTVKKIFKKKSRK